MISFSQGQSLFTKLSLNNTTDNQTLYGLLSNIEQRYLLQDFFANEGSYAMQTIGQTSLTLNGALSIGATSATLAAAWPYQTSTVYVTFSDGEVVNALLTNGSTTMTWAPGLQGLIQYLTAPLTSGATSATLSSAWLKTSGAYLASFSDGSTKTITFTNGSTAISWIGGLSNNVLNQIFTAVIPDASNPSIGGVQFYPMPPNYSKLKDVTITVGELKWTLTECRTREEWDNMNVFPYYASIPQKFFIYPGGDHGGQIGIWPIPSTTGNILTFNYKFRVPDLSIADYNTDTTGGQAVTGAGTVTVTNGSTAVTGAATVFTPTTNPQLESRWLRIPQPSGDNLWYQIQNISSTTALTLYQPYQGVTAAGTVYTIGQMPLIAEDFQDMPVWKSLTYYFTSLVDNPAKCKEYQDNYDRKMKLLEKYSGSNTVNVNLSPKGYRPASQSQRPEVPHAGLERTLPRDFCGI